MASVLTLLMGVGMAAWSVWDIRHRIDRRIPHWGEEVRSDSGFWASIDRGDWWLKNIVGVVCGVALVAWTLVRLIA